MQKRNIPLVAACGSPKELAEMTTMMPTMRFVGAKLRRLREERFVSQRDLAKRAEVSPTTILHLETGENPNPRLSTVRKIAEALGIDPNELVEHN
jgi:DNA-binding XRE family transcriptional regulator